MSLGPVRTVKAIYSLFALVKDPNRLGQVFEMADFTHISPGLAADAKAIEQKLAK